MDQELREFIEKQKELVISSYEQAKSYSNIIIMGGYAGLFALWSFTKAELEKWQTMCVGLLALLSILSFVIFEIFGAWMRTTQTFSLLRQLKEAEKLNRFPSNYGKQEMRRAESMAKIWPYFFFFTLGSGVAAAVILGWSFVAKLICG